MKNTTWIVSELYYPELTSTGQILTDLAEGLAEKGLTVNVICGQPAYSLRGTKVPWNEIMHGVSIFRCWGTVLDKNKIFLRLINNITLSLSVFLKSIAKFKKNDDVVVVTNPPILPFLVYLAAFLKRSKVVLIVHDIYPDILVASRKIKKESFIFKLWEKMTVILFRLVDHVVVIGRDMNSLIIEKNGIQESKVTFIPNWSDFNQIVPKDKHQNEILIDLNINNKFVVQYAGNMGHPHAIETILGAIEKIRNNDIAFLFIGSGAKKKIIDNFKLNNPLVNFYILPNQPRSEQNNFLNACDISLITLIPGMKGISVPSRTYNVLAAGKPIIALMEKECEVARLVSDESIGWVVDPSDSARLAEAIEQACNDKQTLLAMGERARLLACQRYTFSTALEQYYSLLMRKHLE